jgi:hypothetical protein
MAVCVCEFFRKLNYPLTVCDDNIVDADDDDGRNIKE